MQENNIEPKTEQSIEETSDVGQKLKLAMILFRNTGIIHDILKKQLEFLAIGILNTDIYRLESMQFNFDLENKHVPRKLIFKVQSGHKTVKCPKTLRKFCRFLIGEEFAIQIRVVK